MLDPLNQILQEKGRAINDWIEKKWEGLKPVLYLSCDMRHSGYKIGVVDANIFPAGFNNLCSNFSKETSGAFRSYFENYYPHAKNILIYAEEHTRNKFYFKNLIHLKSLIEKTGKNVQIGMLGQFMTDSKLIADVENQQIIIERLGREGQQITANGFIPDLIVSNNDFSFGLPEIFKDIDQEIIPGPFLGWHRRKKINFFTYFDQLIDDFSDFIKMDSWFFKPMTLSVNGIKVDEKDSFDILAKVAEEVLLKTKEKYDHYGINQEPCVYIKSNSGTYGMGLITVSSAEDVKSLNRKQRNKLFTSRSGEVDSYLVQEAIPTADFYSGYPLEPVIYCVGKKDVGGFFRIHESKNEWESLNSPGMTFSCLCLHKLNEPHENMFLDCKQKESLVRICRLMSQLASMAVSQEVKSSF